MEVFTDKKAMAAFSSAHKLHLALGYFDGVHLGHQSLLDYVLRAARNEGGEAGVLLLEPHPLKVLKGNGGVKNLNTLEDKIRLIQAYGDIHIFIIPFDLKLAALSPEAFVREYLADIFHIKTVVCGFNYSFGSRGEGNAALLEKLGKTFGFSCGVLPQITYEGKTVSSTEIRRRVEEGRMREAYSLLGHSHIYTGRVAGGNRLGRKMGFPTANLEMDRDLTWPAYGVYGGLIQDEKGRIFRGAVNAGIRPTIKQEDKAPSFEVYLTDFSGDLYGSILRVALTDRLRPEMRFSGLDALQKQIAADIEKASLALDAWETEIKEKSGSGRGGCGGIF